MTNCDSDIPDWEYAKQGIIFWLNNDPAKAEQHFKVRSDSTRVYASFAFTTVMNAVISYETDKIELAQEMLRELERRCSTTTGWIQSIRTRIFGYESNVKRNEDLLEEKIIVADALICSAILTFLTQDIGGLMKGSWLLRKAWKIYEQLYGQIYQLYKAVPHENGRSTDGSESGQEPVTPMEFAVGQNRSSMVRSQTTHQVANNYEIDQSHKKPDSILHQYRKSLKNFHNEGSSMLPRNMRSQLPKSVASMLRSDKLSPLASHSNKFDCPFKKSDISASCHTPSENHPSKSGLYLNLASNQSNGFIQQVPLSCPEPVATPLTKGLPFVVSDIDRRTVIRLMGAVSFGFGIFQLSVSLLPPSLLRLISFFGFEGNKDLGIACLTYAKSTENMRSPMATLALLWYYTIGAQLFHGEGGHMQDEIAATRQILKDSQEEYATSAIFLFFSARLKRLQCKANVAIDLYDAAYRMSAQRELKLLCLHEVGWCRLINLDFGNAMLHFHELKLASNFSKSFYTYMTTICQGAFGRFDNLIRLKEEMIIMISKNINKETQIDRFLLRRITKLPSHESDHKMFDAQYWKFFIYEMLFLWNTLYSCPLDILNIIITDCSKPKETLNEPSVGLAKLILGSCRMHLQQPESAIEEFRDCIHKRDGIIEDIHLSAFAHYELATLLLKRRTEPDQSEAKNLLLDIQRLYKNYDFETRLSARVYAALKNL